MARLLFGGANKWCCSYKRTTIIVCSINIIAALYVLNSLYSSLNIFSFYYRPNYPGSDVQYTEEQTRKMEDSIKTRLYAEPKELVRLVNNLKEEFAREKSLNLSRPSKIKLTEEVLHMLKGINESATVAQQREALEYWRKGKLKEIKELELGTKTSNSTVTVDEAEMLRVALESDWDMLLEYLGVWIPQEIVNKEPDGDPKGYEDLDDSIIPGRPLPPECHVERHTDYGGAAVKWGLTHHKESAADCCQACLDQAKQAKPGQIKCNIWVYCPSETGCFSPDIYEHKHQECWLKQTMIEINDKQTELQASASNVTAHSVATQKHLVSTVEKPKKFNGTEFKRWQQKMFFYLTTLNLVKFLTETTQYSMKKLRTLLSSLLLKHGLMETS